jgi:hypothetical protein
VLLSERVGGDVQYQILSRKEFSKHEKITEVK